MIGEDVPRRYVQYMGLTRPKDEVMRRMEIGVSDMGARSPGDTFEYRAINHQEKALHRT